jgi:hypothetical protein
MANKWRELCSAMARISDFANKDVKAPEAYEWVG